MQPAFVRQGGHVHGRSDAQGAYPEDGLVRPQDITATIFNCLGYPPETVIHDVVNRPHPISRGEMIRAVLPA